MPPKQKLTRKQEQEQELDIANRLSGLSILSETTEPEILNNELVTLSDLYNTYKDLTYDDDKLNDRHQKILDYILLRTEMIQSIQYSQQPHEPHEFEKRYPEVQHVYPTFAQAIVNYADDVKQKYNPDRQSEPTFASLDNLSSDTRLRNWSAKEDRKKDLEGMGFKTAIDMNSELQARNEFREKVTKNLNKLGIRDIDSIEANQESAKRYINECAGKKMARVSSEQRKEYEQARDELLKINFSNSATRDVLSGKLEPVKYVIYPSNREDIILDDIKNNAVDDVKGLMINVKGFPESFAWGGDPTKLSQLETPEEILKKKCEDFQKNHEGMTFEVHYFDMAVESSFKGGIGDDFEKIPKINRIDIQFANEKVASEFMKKMNLSQPDGKLWEVSFEKIKNEEQRKSQLRENFPLAKDFESYMRDAIKEYERSKIIVPSERKNNINEIKSMIDNWDDVSKNIKNVQAYLGNLDSSSKLKQKLEGAITEFKEANKDNLNKLSNNEEGASLKESARKTK